jgi:spore germination protein KC
MIRVRLLILFIKLSLTILLLTGCWSRVEVNDIAIVTAVGLDQTDNGKILLSLELAIPRMLGVANQVGGDKIETTAGWIVSGEGDTILEANRFIQQKLPRKIVYSHSKVIVVGEKLARDGVVRVLDFFERYKQSQIRSYIMFTKGEAAEILKFKPKFEKLSSEVIREEEKSQISLSIRVLQFMDMLMSEGDAPAAAQIQLTPSEIGKSNSSKESISVKGVAIFKKDKLIGWLNEKETRGFLWLKNQMKEAVTTVEIPKDKGGGQVSSQIHNAKTSIKPKIEKKSITIKVDADADIEIFENTSKLDLGDPKDVEYIAKLVEEDLKLRLELICKKAQGQLKTDIFGFGRVVYHHYPKEWKNTYSKEWEKLFPELEVVIVPHINVSQVGLINKSITVE